MTHEKSNPDTNIKFGIFLKEKVKSLLSAVFGQTVGILDVSHYGQNSLILYLFFIYYIENDSLKHDF